MNDTYTHYFDAPGVDDPRAFAATLVGDCMTPEYRDGDLAVFPPDAEVTDGCAVFVELANGFITFKRIRLGDKITLVPDNPAHKARTFDDAEIARVVRCVAVYRLV